MSLTKHHEKLFCDPNATGTVRGAQSYTISTKAAGFPATGDAGVRVVGSAGGRYVNRIRIVLAAAGCHAPGDPPGYGWRPIRPCVCAEAGIPGS